MENHLNDTDEPTGWNHDKLMNFDRFNKKSPDKEKKYIKEAPLLIKKKKEKPSKEISIKV